MGHFDEQIYIFEGRSQRCREACEEKKYKERNLQCSEDLGSGVRDVRQMTPPRQPVITWQL